MTNIKHCDFFSFVADFANKKTQITNLMDRKANKIRMEQSPPAQKSSRGKGKRKRSKQTPKTEYDTTGRVHRVDVIDSIDYDKQIETLWLEVLTNAEYFADKGLLLVFLAYYTHLLNLIHLNWVLYSHSPVGAALAAQILIFDAEIVMYGCYSDHLFEIRGAKFEKTFSKFADILKGQKHEQKIKEFINW